MFSSRNIHFAILGLILGAASGYIFAFYQVQRNAPVEAASSSASSPGVPQNHPQVTNDQMLALFKEAMDKNPNEPELMTRYAGFLFDIKRFQEAVDWYRKVLAIQPNNLDVIHDLAVAHIDGDGDLQKAAELLKRLEEIDSKYSALPSLQLRLEDRQRRGKTAK